MKRYLSFACICLLLLSINIKNARADNCRNNQTLNYLECLTQSAMDLYNRLMDKARSNIEFQKLDDLVSKSCVDPESVECARAKDYQDTYSRFETYLRGDIANAPVFTHPEIPGQSPILDSMQKLKHAVDATAKAKSDYNTANAAIPNLDGENHDWNLLQNKISEINNQVGSATDAISSAASIVRDIGLPGTNIVALTNTLNAKYKQAYNKIQMGARKNNNTLDIESLVRQLSSSNQSVGNAIVDATDIATKLADLERGEEAGLIIGQAGPLLDKVNEEIPDKIIKGESIGIIAAIPVQTQGDLVTKVFTGLNIHINRINDLSRKIDLALAYNQELGNAINSSASTGTAAQIKVMQTAAGSAIANAKTAAQGMGISMEHNGYDNKYSQLMLAFNDKVIQVDTNNKIAETNVQNEEVGNAIAMLNEAVKDLKAAAIRLDNSERFAHAEIIFNQMRSQKERIDGMYNNLSATLGPNIAIQKDVSGKTAKDIYQSGDKILNFANHAQGALHQKEDLDITMSNLTPLTMSDAYSKYLAAIDMHKMLKEVRNGGDMPAKIEQDLQKSINSAKNPNNLVMQIAILASESSGIKKINIIRQKLGGANFVENIKEQPSKTEVNAGTGRAEFKLDGKEQSRPSWFASPDDCNNICDYRAFGGWNECSPCFLVGEENRPFKGYNKCGSTYINKNTALKCLIKI